MLSEYAKHCDVKVCTDSRYWAKEYGRRNIKGICQTFCFNTKNNCWRPRFFRLSMDWLSDSPPPTPRQLEHRYCHLLFLSLVVFLLSVCSPKEQLKSVVFSAYLRCPMDSCTAKNQYWKLATNIPRKGIERPQSQFPHSYVWEGFIYCTVFPLSICLVCCKKYVDRSWE